MDRSQTLKRLRTGKVLSPLVLRECSCSDGITLSETIEKALLPPEQRTKWEKARFAGDGKRIMARRPELNVPTSAIPASAALLSVFIVRWPRFSDKKGKKVEISDRDFERFLQIDERLLTTFSEKSHLEKILKKSGLSLPELRDIVTLIRVIESEAQKLLGEEIGVKVISGEEIGVKVLTFIAREEKKSKKLLAVIKAGFVEESPPRKVHSQLIINLLGPQWSVVEKTHYPKIYAMIIAQSLGRVALAYPEVCNKLAINPARVAEEMVEKYSDAFDARELWINVYKILATKIGQLIIGEETYNAGAGWIINYDLPQKHPEKAKERLRDEETEKIRKAKREKLPMFAGWQAEAIITGNKSVADRIEVYVKGICKKPQMERYRLAVKDYVRVTEKVTAGLLQSKLKGDGRP
jgi:hypothetical protein